jgi:hypothetical protein
MFKRKYVKENENKILDKINFSYLDTEGDLIKGDIVAQDEIRIKTKEYQYVYVPKNILLELYNLSTEFDY